MRKLMLCLSCLAISGCGLLPETTIVERRFLLCPVAMAELHCKMRDSIVDCYEAEKQINLEARGQCRGFIHDTH